MRKPDPTRRLAPPLWPILLLGLFLPLLLVGCGSVSTPELPSPVPYHTRTPTLSPSPGPRPTLPPPTLPIPSPTPFPYTIRPGDTLEGLARRFNLSVDDLLRQNPGLTSLLQPGQVIQIPAPKPQADLTTPTPAPLELAQPACYPQADKTQTCFFAVHNPGSDWLENIALQVEIIPRNASPKSQLLFLPLDILPPHSTLPAFTTFEVPPEQTSSMTARVSSALRLPPEDRRYLPATVHRLQIVIAPSGLQAQISGEVYLPPGTEPAGRIWLAATAYDAERRVSGFYRQELGALLPAHFLPFTVSLGSFVPIADVELIVEARP